MPLRGAKKHTTALHSTQQYSQKYLDYHYFITKMFGLRNLGSACLYVHDHIPRPQSVFPGFLIYLQRAKLLGAP